MTAAHRLLADDFAGDEDGLDNPFTTKEGWRRFVDKDPQPPVLLSEEARASLDASARAGYDEVRIETPNGVRSW